MAVLGTPIQWLHWDPTGDQHFPLAPRDFVKLTGILSATTPTMSLPWRTANVPQTLQNLRIIWAGMSSEITKSSCYPSTVKLTPNPCPSDMAGIKRKQGLF